MLDEISTDMFMDDREVKISSPETINEGNLKLN
jgi:hypothetical protein